MRVHMVLGLQETLYFSSRRVYMDPRLIRREAQSLRREPGIHKPRSHRVDSLGARGERLHNLLWSIMLPVLRRLGMGDFEEKFLEAVHVLLRETEAHGQDLMRLKAAGGDPVEWLDSAPFVDYVRHIGAR